MKHAREHEYSPSLEERDQNNTEWSGRGWWKGSQSLGFPGNRHASLPRSNQQACMERGFICRLSVGTRFKRGQNRDNRVSAAEANLTGA